MLYTDRSRHQHQVFVVKAKSHLKLTCVLTTSLCLCCRKHCCVVQTFGKLQAKLFPKYFALLSTSTAICLGTIAFAPGSTLPRSQLVTLGEILNCCCALYIASVTEPTLDVHPIHQKIPLRRFLQAQAIVGATVLRDTASHAADLLMWSCSSWSCLCNVTKCVQRSLCSLHAWCMAARQSW